jgi:hypothetical protein
MAFGARGYGQYFQGSMLLTMRALNETWVYIYAAFSPLQARYLLLC